MAWILTESYWAAVVPLLDSGDGPFLLFVSFHTRSFDIQFPALSLVWGKLPMDVFRSFIRDAIASIGVKSMQFDESTWCGFWTNEARRGFSKFG